MSCETEHHFTRAYPCGYDDCDDAHCIAVCGDCGHEETYCELTWRVDTAHMTPVEMFAEPEDEDVWVNEGGSPWWLTKIPRRWHVCKPYASRWVDDENGVRYVRICKCGASSTPFSGWKNKNMRRNKL